MRGDVGSAEMWKDQVGYMKLAYRMGVGLRAQNDHRSETMSAELVEFVRDLKIFEGRLKTITFWRIWRAGWLQVEQKKTSEEEDEVDEERTMQMLTPARATARWRWTTLPARLPCASCHL